ncbi:MAG TPA: GNAT family N-acetyltransferase, partial [Mycobacteriales bacterium]|nr:GNAT family N-acetyltransferase [Mycobacteriales bacterium]
MRPGDRVSLRVRSPAGPRDVVGELVAAGPTSLSVRRRDGAIEHIAVDDVEAGRVVPPGPER